MTVALHPYVKINGQYYALRQNILLLAYYLYFKNKSLQRRSGFKSGQILDTLKRLHRIQRGFEKETDRLRLPVFGHICLPIHQGYKIFNFRKGSVFKLFDRQLPADVVAAEIAYVCETNALDFAPKIQDRRIEERWFEEELVHGTVGYGIPHADAAALMAFYEREIASILERMILFRKPVYTRLSKKIDSCLAEIHAGLRLSGSGLDPEKVAQIEQGVENLVHRLREAGDMTVGLVFSHGDFSFKNILLTRQGTRVIDWEGAGLRSVFFDLYNWFFTERYYDRVSSNLVFEIGTAVSSLKARLAETAPDIHPALLTPESTGRFLYYLERLTLLLQRDLSDELLKVILSSYAVFMKHEENRDELGYSTTHHETLFSKHSLERLRGME